MRDFCDFLGFFRLALPARFRLYSRFLARCGFRDPFFVAVRNFWDFFRFFRLALPAYFRLYSRFLARRGFRDRFFIVMRRFRNFFLRPYHFPAFAAMAAFRLACLRTACRYCWIYFFRMRDFCDFPGFFRLALPARFRLYSRFLARRGFCHPFFIVMRRFRNFFLRAYHFPAFTAMAAFGLACLRTARRDCRINYFCMSFFCDLLCITVSTAGTCVRFKSRLITCRFFRYLTCIGMLMDRRRFTCRRIIKYNRKSCHSQILQCFHLSGSCRIICVYRFRKHQKCVISRFCAFRCMQIISPRILL